MYTITIIRNPDNSVGNYSGPQITAMRSLAREAGF